MLAGLAVAAAAAYFAVQRDNTLRSLDDIRARFGLPLLGSVPEYQPLGNGVPPAPDFLQLMPELCYLRRPNSVAATSFAASSAPTRTLSMSRATHSKAPTFCW